MLDIAAAVPVAVADVEVILHGFDKGFADWQMVGCHAVVNVAQLAVVHSPVVANAEVQIVEYFLHNADAVAGFVPLDWESSVVEAS